MAKILRKSDTFRTAIRLSFSMLAVWASVLPLGIPVYFALLAAAAVQPGPALERQLEAAIHREIVLGDLKGAVEQYKAILSRSAKSRNVTARALFQMGECLEKSGRRAEARDSYSQVLKEYGDQAEVASRARTRLADLADSIPGPANLKFDHGVPGKLPPAWFVPALPSEGDNWAQLRKQGCMKGGNCAVVLVPENAPTNVGNLMQSFSAAAYRGKTLRFTAWLRLEAADAADRAQMWLSVDRANNKKGFFENMSDRPVRSSEWAMHEIRGRVDDDATFIKFGVMSIGRGRVWVDSVALDVIPSPGAKPGNARPQ